MGLHFTPLTSGAGGVDFTSAPEQFLDKRVVYLNQLCSLSLLVKYLVRIVDQNGEGPTSVVCHS